MKQHLLYNKLFFIHSQIVIVIIIISMIRMHSLNTFRYVQIHLQVNMYKLIGLDRMFNCTPHTGGLKRVFNKRKQSHG